MYELKTLLPQFEIQLPTCMYSLKNVGLTGDVASSGALVASEDNKVHNITVKATTPTWDRSSPLSMDNLGAQIQKILKSSCDANAVTFRQEKVLKQLNELKEQLAGIRSTLGVCAKGPQHTGLHTGANGGLREEPLHDIVINGHPNFIPYALLALKNAWRDLYTIDVKVFRHSTMKNITKEAIEFEKKLAQVPTNESLRKINVSLIWKNCEHTEMISSPTMYVPIYGEVNIIRYLGRVGPAEYRYEDSPYCNEIDCVLDICYQLLRVATPAAKAAIVRALNSRLQKQKYFGGEQMSVADIGVHSSLKRMPSIVDKDLTPALVEWRKRVQAVTAL